MNNINYTDEEIQQLHRARIERMQMEKKQQEEQRRKFKKLLPGIACGICLLILALVLMIAFVGKDEEKVSMPQAKQVETAVEESTEEKQSKNNEQVVISALPQPVAEKAFQGMDRIELISVPTLREKEEKTEPLITFDETDDTVDIFAEEVMSSNAILIREDTNEIIAAKGAYDRIVPASMTKVLTVLVAAEHIRPDELNNTFTMTTEITDYAYVNDCSSVGFLDGEVVTVRDLFYGTVLPSGGDAAVGLATYVAGSHEAFVDMMNIKLEELGLSDSAHFTNCVGLYDEEHYCTVYDMAVIMKAAVQNEMCREFLSLHTYTTTATEQHSEGITISNWFLRRIEDKDTGGEVICAKTGYVKESKSCAVSYATCAGGTPYICVTVGAHSGWRCIYDHVEIYNRYVENNE